jgi:hypothetical protein
MFYQVSRLVAINAKEGSAHYEAPREEASSSSQMDGWFLSALETFKEESGLTTGIKFIIKCVCTCTVASRVWGRGRVVCV